MLEARQEPANRADSLRAKQTARPESACRRSTIAVGTMIIVDAAGVVAPIVVP